MPFKYNGLTYNPKNTVLAKNLRKQSTSEENRLWYDFLSGYPIRFQRQRPIGDFIVDFYCHQAKLVIEIDGAQHLTDRGRECDSGRTRFLETKGLAVLRFTNRQIKEDFNGVCTYIDGTVQTILTKT